MSLPAMRKIAKALSLDVQHGMQDGRRGYYLLRQSEVLGHYGTLDSLADEIARRIVQAHEKLAEAVVETAMQVAIAAKPESSSKAFGPLPTHRRRRQQ